MRVVPPAMRRQLGEGANSSILQRLVAFFGYGGAIGIAVDSLLRLQSLEQEVDKVDARPSLCNLLPVCSSVQGCANRSLIIIRVHGPP